MKVTRTLGPWGPGLAGFIDNKLAVVILVKPKHPARWALQSVTARDRARIREALADMNKDEP